MHMCTGHRPDLVACNAASPPPVVASPPPVVGELQMLSVILLPGSDRTCLSSCYFKRIATSCLMHMCTGHRPDSVACNAASPPPVVASPPPVVGELQMLSVMLLLGSDRTCLSYCYFKRIANSCLMHMCTGHRPDSVACNAASPPPVVASPPPVVGELQMLPVILLS